MAQDALSHKILVPPLNFAMILKGVYRSGHPNLKNFAFMETLKLRSIMYLSEDDYRPDTLHWAERNTLNIFHHRIEASKEPFVEPDQDKIVEALEQILDSRNLPSELATQHPPPNLGIPEDSSLLIPPAVLIHDNKGRLLPSILGALLRLLQHWSFTATLAEYRMFLPDEKVWAEGQVGKPEKGRERVADLEFIDRFPLERVKYDPRYAPEWLIK